MYILELQQLHIIRGKCLITISTAFIILAIGLILATNKSLSSSNYNFNFETVNIQNISPVRVSMKKDALNQSLNKLILKEVAMTQTPATTTTTPKKTTIIKTTIKTETKVNQTPTRQWYLPTQYGTVSQYPRYGHVALDITSPRGTAEGVYPVAEGTISDIYRDYAGALIVTVNHRIDGKNYTSQYVHLSSYAPGLYVGKHVTVNDRLGQMGSTGISTGVHLHLAVMDCSFYNDGACYNLGNLLSYANKRYSQGFYGLPSVMNVPYSWSSR